MKYQYRLLWDFNEDDDDMMMNDERKNVFYWSRLHEPEVDVVLARSGPLMKRMECQVMSAGGAFADSD